jgi:hypothetical protein
MAAVIDRQARAGVEPHVFALSLRSMPVSAT